MMGLDLIRIYLANVYPPTVACGAIFVYSRFRRGRIMHCCGYPSIGLLSAEKDWISSIDQWD